ncbi:MAG: NAD(P)/FAD-dependent oxidoreductase [Rhodobiaceae bacterium]|nr:NAD(P)/FAD-dependent oxidoreductase [Rhodobiaceae bacterium]
MPGIDRRDFLNGVALSVGVGAAFSPNAAIATATSSGNPPYPPSLTGMRGFHPGSFEVAHSMAWEGEVYGRAETSVDEPYDLIVVGGGLSGLSAARFFQQKKPDARILILDNHDDFGGHAKRNEFTVDGHHLVGYGGSQTIDSPSSYSVEAQSLLSDIGIDTDRFYKYFDRDFYSKKQMGTGVFFDREHYGEDQLLRAPSSLFGAAALILFGGGDGQDDAYIDALPLLRSDKEIFRHLALGDKDYLEGKSDEEKTQLLSAISYSAYLRDYAGASEPVIRLIKRNLAALEAVSWDAVPAIYAAELLMPGTRGLGLEGSTVIPILTGAQRYLPTGVWRGMSDAVLGAAGVEPYIFHFPDGNAGIARLLVRRLMPHVASGRTMEDMVGSELHYRELDSAVANVRCRLESTVVDVRHHDDRQRVDVSYVQKGQHLRATGDHAILACNHKVIPYVCGELPEMQRLALDEAERAPLCSINVALRNWQAFHAAGVNLVYAPEAGFSTLMLDFPVSMGDVEFSADPDKPILLHIIYTPSAHLDAEGKTLRELFREGQHVIYRRSFENFETEIRAQLNAMLGKHGFDADRDIAAITVNRWPHGYAYLPVWPDEPGIDDPASPHFAARAQHHRISIANSDAEYKAYVNGAMDAAWRAVEEQIAIANGEVNL